MASNRMTDRFVYILVIPDHPEEEFTPMAGFSPGLIGFEWAPQKIVTLPADIWDPALPDSGRINRKARGQGSHNWFPLNLSALQVAPLDMFGPLVVLFTNDEATARAVEAAIKDRTPRPLHASRTPVGRALRSGQLTRDRLRAFAEASARNLNQPQRDAYLGALRKWPAQRFKRSTLRYRSHNVTLANEMVLLSEGLLPSDARQPDPSSDRDYVRALCDSARAVRRLRRVVGQVPAAGAYPLYPDLILFAPAMYRGLYQRLRRSPDAPRGALQALRLIQRQTGYAFQIEKEEDAAFIGSSAWVFVNKLRSEELRIQSAGVGMVATASIATTLRLPARVNRISGVVAALAAHLRAHPDAERKTGRVFRAVQQALISSLDPALIDLISSASTGVRVIADAPIEWLPINGLPLMFRLQASRIGATPGNLSFGELVNSAPMVVRQGALDEILHIRSFDLDDPIRNHMQVALAHIASDADIKIRTIDVRSRKELIAALNAFAGLLVIFDTHGLHEAGRAAQLVVGPDQIDVWSLRGRARIPPIVVLSACDTHAVDGTHATVANGFIACGARAVLATFLPVRSIDSSVLVARLILRARKYVSILNDRGQSVSWSRVVTLGLQAQLITDVLRRLERTLNLTEEEVVSLLEKATARVNFGDDEWWSSFQNDISEQTGWAKDQLDDFLQTSIAGSDVIRYVHVGNPESVILSHQQVFDRLDGAHSRNDDANRDAFGVNS